MKKEKNIWSKYGKKFSKNSFFSLISKRYSTIGSKTVYTGLLLYFAFRRDETPTWAKNIILGTLGYLISPIDGIPDLTPVLGYTDDIGILSFGLVTIASYVNDEVRTKAKSKLTNWFPRLDQGSLHEIDQKI